MTEETLRELKAKSFTMIERDRGHGVPLASWQGWASVTPAPHVNKPVKYFLEGNRLRVCQGTEEGWYTLS